MVVHFRGVLEILGYAAKKRDVSGAEVAVLIDPTLQVGNPIILIGHSGNVHNEKDLLTIVLVAHNVEVFPSTSARRTIMKPVGMRLNRCWM